VKTGLNTEKTGESKKPTHQPADYSFSRLAHNIHFDRTAFIFKGLRPSLKILIKVRN